MIQALASFIAELLSEIVGANIVGRIMSKAFAAKISGQPVSGTTATAPNGTTARIEGSLGKLEDEIGYARMMAMLTNGDKDNKKLAAKISEMLLAELPTPGQQERFRKIFGALTAYDLVTKVEKVGDKTTEMKSNLAVSLLKELSEYTADQRLAFFKVAGIYYSSWDRMEKAFEKWNEKSGEEALLFIKELAQKISGKSEYSGFFATFFGTWWGFITFPCNAVKKIWRARRHG